MSSWATIQPNDRWNHHTDPHRIVERISERIFAVEFDGKRLNISVERLQLAYFIAQQK